MHTLRGLAIGAGISVLTFSFSNCGMYVKPLEEANLSQSLNGHAGENADGDATGFAGAELEELPPTGEPGTQNRSKIGLLLGVNVLQPIVDKIGDNGGSWYYTYSPHPNRSSAKGDVNTVNWANKYQKEFVPMVAIKRFKFAEGSESCPMISEYAQAGEKECTIEQMVAALLKVKALFTATNQPKYLIGFNEVYKSTVIVGGTSVPMMEAKDAAKAWARLQAVALQTNLKLVSPSVAVEPQAQSWFASFLKTCYDHRADVTFPCDVDQIHTIAIHGYECNANYWNTNFGQQGYQKALIAQMGSYGGKDWATLIKSRKIWITETTCNWDSDFTAEQGAGRFVRSSKEACLRATGQRNGNGVGSLLAIANLPSDRIERVSWWTTYMNPETDTDVPTGVTLSSQNRSNAARLFDAQLNLTPAGRAVFTASTDPTKLKDVNCTSLDRFPTSFQECHYILRGAGSYQWSTVRKSLIRDNCVVSTFSVKQNNPGATIVQGPTVMDVNSDGGMASDTSSAHTLGYHYRCEFDLQGAAGARWKVARLAETDDGCVRAAAKVKASNPNAIVSSAVPIFVGGDNGFANPNSSAHRAGEYFECRFSIVRGDGLAIKSYRRTEVDDNCSAAQTYVQAHNPKARSISVAEKVFNGIDF